MHPGRGVAIAKIVIVGVGVVGFAGLLLSGDGHEVKVLERDAEAAPAGAEEIWETWQRKGVSQFRLPHFFLARYRDLLDSELPEVKKGLIAAGAVCRNPVLDAPEAIRGSAREGDDAFECISGRRCVVEAAVASVAGRAPHLEIRRGAAAAGLVTGSSAHDGVPHVAGVRLGTGEEITADLVVDMTGRRSPLPRWLEAVGARSARDPWEFACSFHHATAEMVEPWYRDTLAADRHRLAEIDALIDGSEYRPRDPGWEIGQALANAAFKDPDCFRGFVGVTMVLSRAADVTARPGLLDKVIALGAGWRDEPLPAPNRAELLSIVAGD